MYEKVLEKILFKIYNTTKKEIGIVNEEKKIITYIGKKNQGEI